MGILDHLTDYNHTLFTMSPKDTEVVEEPVITFQKFGEMELPEDEEVDDVDYVPSDIDSEDSLEWSSETERTKAEDALAEGKVGLDFYNAVVPGQCYPQHHWPSSCSCCGGFFQTAS